MSNSQSHSLPPPLFANQRSNLSALASSMGSFSSVTLRENNDSDINHEEQALLFLREQQDRITKIEESLLESTEQILPLDITKCMTVSELLQVCTSLQQANVQLMKHLDEKMSSGVFYSSILSDQERVKSCLVNRHGNDEETSPNTNNTNTTITTTPLSIWQQQPLEQVVETDNETDATTTPGSSTFFSPPLSSTASSSNREGGTPVTPSIENLHLSSNTAAVLEDISFHQDDDEDNEERHSLDAIEAWRARKYSLYSFQQQQQQQSHSHVDPRANVEAPVKAEHVDEGMMEEAAVPEEPPQEQSNDKDSVSTASSSTSNAKERVVADSSTIVGCSDLTFLDDDSAVATVATILAPGRQPRQQRQATIPEVEEHELLTPALRKDVVLKPKASPAVPLSNTNTTIVDCSDETMVEHETVKEADVTVIGKDCRHRNAVAPLSSSKPEDRADEQSVGAASSESPGEHTVKEIIVDTSASSCSMGDDANMTSDVSVLDASTLASPRSIVNRNNKEETQDEQTTASSLLVTPVLDRYRLEADDTSIGVKVVPNERGTRHDVSKHRQKNLLTKYGGTAVSRPTVMQAKKPPPKTPTAKQDEDEMPSKSPFVTQRERKVYRKTPHPKKTGQRDFMVDDENESPNPDTTTTTRTPLQSDRRETKSKSESRLRSPFTRISLPELTQRPYRSSIQSAGEPRRLPFSASKSQAERRHTISFKQQPSISRTPLTAAWIAKHMPEEADSLDVSEDSSFTFS